MTDRERTLAIVVGVCVAIVTLWFISGYYTSAVSYRTGQISSLDSQLKKQRLAVTETMKAAKKLSEYEARSLPPDTALARSAYQHWLLTKLEDAGLRDQVVSPSGQRPTGDIFVQQTFTVNGKGRYEQIVKLLYDIYRVDLLHRVSRVSIKPIKDSKELDLQLTLDALSLRSAAPANDLTERPSQRLKLAKLEDYQNSIVGRNIFAPPNTVPRLSGLGRQRGTTNRSLEISAKATDPDPLDVVNFELIKSASKDARLDANGRFSWTPRKAGEYEFEIAVRDDNFPPRISTEKLIVTVTDPPPPPREVPRPPPPPVDDEPKLAFDNAKHTVLSAIISVGAEGEIWLYVRPTAQLLKLHEGEAFEIGSVKGTVREILDNEFVYESNNKKTKGKHLRVSKGENLEQATVMPVAAAIEVPAAIPPANSVPDNSLPAVPTSEGTSGPDQKSEVKADLPAEESASDAVPAVKAEANPPEVPETEETK
ncbi:hypothetical protein ETAA8_12270 [Anatilimnocola aggregata]|uniref:Cadherin domain-containing protein n=1 Tax=Anatilimnocola aggregata TaxID=2528021 RepID=A0A517Y7D7_9BACT|nr:hypothetical protein [Anatilimnocola aggregata]QDU26153.1 hypothetical protein ETAA8_12270 [Anatilimnocola aggregata]